MATATLANHVPAEPKSSAGTPLVLAEIVSRVVRGVTRVILVVSCLVALLVFGLALAQWAYGYQTMTVLSGSMTPAIGVGSLVVTKPVPADQVRIGDVITFHPPNDGSVVVTHRVVALESSEGAVGSEAAPRYFVTKGDANPLPDRWRVAATGVKDRVVWHAGGMGWMLRLSSDRPLRLAFLLLPASLLCFVFLAEIWRPSGRRDAASGS
jgi:signal peptidase